MGDCVMNCHFSVKLMVTFGFQASKTSQGLIMMSLSTELVSK